MESGKRGEHPLGGHKQPILTVMFWPIAAYGLPKFVNAAVTPISL
jgi:hypothetical protein